MEQREIACKFIDYFCAGDIAGIAQLLDEQLRFDGSLCQFSSREEYLASLYADPPVPADYQILSVTEGNHEVAVFYRYRKPTGSLMIAQLFEFSNSKIINMRVVFNSSEIR